MTQTAGGTLNKAGAITTKGRKPDTLRRYKVYGRSFLAHPGCSDGFKTDRRLGLIYGPYSVDGKLMNVEEASIAAHFCTYCGE